MNGDFLTATVAAAGAAVAASTRPAPVERSPGPCPPAAESLAECVRLGLIELQADGSYRALMRGRRGPHDPGIVADDEKGGEA